MTGNGNRQRWSTGLTIGILVVGVAILFFAVQPLSAASARAAASPGGVGISAGVSSPPTITASPKTCATGTNPEYVAYDPVNGYFYVSNVNGASVSVYKSTCTSVATITLPTHALPRGIAFDASDNYLFVADEYNSAVYVISGTSVIQTITSSLIQYPWGLTYDPSAGYYGFGGTIVVTDFYSDNVTWITDVPGTGLAAWFNLPVGSGPIGVAYSPTFNALMVANTYSDNVTSINASTGVFIDQNIPVGSYPQGVAYDPATLETVVTNEGGSNVTLIDAYGNQFGSIKVGKDPIAVAWDQKDLEMFVCNYGSSTISVISGSKVVKTIHPGTGSEPAGLAYNTGKNQMDVVGWGSDLVYAES
jgi:DNA-binding beta-propeller fold protein YncE